MFLSQKGDYGEIGRYTLRGSPQNVIKGANRFPGVGVVGQWLLREFAVAEWEEKAAAGHGRHHFL